MAGARSPGWLFVPSLAALLACGEPFLEPETGPTCIRQESVSSRGHPDTLDVAAWNLEWFGDESRGPSDDALQLNNARDAILGTDFDVWALEEVVDASAFEELEVQLPGYVGLTANDALVSGGSAHYSRFEQKPAILYKDGLASLVSARVILTADEYAFARRPPLEVKLDVTLNGVTEQRVFIVLHMKAFNDKTSWERRSDASAALKSYLDSNYPTEKVLVIGDWNDDLDTSITPGRPSPYENFVEDPERYVFPTRSLSISGQRTTCRFRDPIDHHLNTNEQHADLVDGSVEVYRLDQQISDYCDTTTDHFPVLARYQFGGGASAPAQIIQRSSDHPCVGGLQ